jgi:hypothetical protein
VFDGSKKINKSEERRTKWIGRREKNKLRNKQVKESRLCQEYKRMEGEEEKQDQYE